MFAIDEADAEVEGAVDETEILDEGTIDVVEILDVDEVDAGADEAVEVDRDELED